MSKYALFICVGNPTDPNGSVPMADARAFARAIKRYWGFDDSEIVMLSSDGKGGLPATRAEVGEQFANAAKLGNVDSLIVGFWGYGVMGEHRRLCLADFDFTADPATWLENEKNTTVSLGSLLKATLRLHARDACFICDCRPLNSSGKPWTIDADDCQTIERAVRKTEPGYRSCATLACSAGERSLDLVEGRRGLFTSSMIAGIEENVRRYGVSFDSVVGFAVQSTLRGAAELGAVQTPFSRYAGDGDVRFEIPRGVRVDETFDAYETEEEVAAVSVLPSEAVESNELDSVDEAEEPKRGRGKRSNEKTAAFAVGLAVFAAALAAAWFFLFR